MKVEDGIYFGLDEAAYHAAPALSASGIKNLRVSPYDFWVRSPYNPNLADVLDEETPSDALILGRAYDCRIVEGRDVFAARYAPEIEHGDHPDSLRTAEELRAALKIRDLKVSGNKPDLIDRLLAADPTEKIWDVIAQGYYAKHDGKEFLSAKLMAKIELAAAMIEKHPELKHAFSGGAPQVAIVWTCPATGVPCKARLDYLKPKAIVDLKTFANLQGKPLEMAISREIASRKYHVQAAMYDEACSHIRAFIKAERVFGNPDPALISALAAGHEKTFLFVFQVKGVAPVARGMVLPRNGMIFGIGQTEVERAKGIFKDCMEKYGPEMPWVDASPIAALDDAAVPSWALE